MLATWMFSHSNTFEGDWVQAFTEHISKYLHDRFFFTTVALSAGYTLQSGMHAFHNGN